MDWKQSYNDICAELSILHLHEMELRKRWEKARQAMDLHVLPLDKAFAMEQKAAGLLNDHVTECQRVESIKQKMERCMNQFDTLENVIKSKRLQGHTLKQIALELGYSYGTIRNKVSKNDNVVTLSANIM